MGCSRTNLKIILLTTGFPCGEPGATDKFHNIIMNKNNIAIITAIIVQLWFQEYKLSLLIGISMVLNMIVAGLFGILVPVSLKKVNIDPALASSVFVTTITDVIGFLSFLGIGSYFFLT